MKTRLPIVTAIGFLNSLGEVGRILDLLLIDQQPVQHVVHGPDLPGQQLRPEARRLHARGRPVLHIAQHLQQAHGHLLGIVLADVQLYVNTRLTV